MRTDSATATRALAALTRRYESSPAIARAALGTLVFYAVLERLWPSPAGVIFQGLIVGSLTALVAFGVALVYGSNRVINFAQADLGAIPAALMVMLITGKGWSFYAALPLALIVAVAMGLFVERVVVRPFAKAPRLILMVATIGLAQILAGLGTALPFLVGAPAIAQRLPIPFDFEFTISPIVFHSGDVVALITVPITIAALLAFLRFTPYGVAVRGCAESADRASLLGINVARTQSVVWVAATLLATIGMMLRAAVVGLPLGSAFGPSILLPALAAAVIGRFENYGRMVAAAMAFGVVEQAIVWNETSNVLLSPTLFVIVLGFLLFQRRHKESRVADQATSTWQEAANARPIPKELAALPEVRWSLRIGSALLAIGLIALPFRLGDGQTNLAAALLVFCMIAASLVILTGWAGELSLGHMGLVAIGSAAAAVINVHYRWDMVPTVLIAGVVGAIAALVIGLPALRVRGLFLAVTTLAFSLVASSFLLDREYFSFLPDNRVERVQRLPLFGRTDVSSERSFYYVCLAALVIVLWVVRGLQRTRMRRVLLATRDNPRAAQAFGIDLTRARLTAFAISGFIAGFAGGMFTLQQQALGQQIFEPAQSLRVLTMVVVGGLGSIPGALLGAVFLKSTEWFNWIVPDQYSFLFSFAGTGIGLLIVLRFLPGGLGQVLYSGRDRLLRQVARRRQLVVPSLLTSERRSASDAARAAAHRAYERLLRARRRGLRRRGTPSGTMPPAGEVLLEVDSINVYYGSVQALFGVSFTVRTGEIVALLGTNGAGKSTLLRAISGLEPARGGRILLAGEDITGLPPHHTVTKGVIQVPGGRGVFPSLTVAENLALAAWPFRGEKDRVAAATERVYEVFPALRERQSQPAATMSGGQQQMLTLGMAFIARPRVLMIDELSLGLAPIIVEQLLELVREINAQGTTVILVEQSVNLALTIANTAYFMEKGEIRFSGPTHDLLERPDLLRSVFLEGAAAAHEPAKVAAKLAHEPIAAAGANGSVKRDVALEIVGLDKAFGGRKVIQSVSFQLHEGEILGIIGPNGAGKTTLFDLISGFLDPDAGDILLGGERVNDLRPDQRVHHGLGRSFQDARLFGALTADETMKVALDRLLEVRDPLAAALGLPDVADAERRIEVLAASLAQRTGVSDFRDKYIAELSTGSRRIVDIACQLGLEPKVLLFDEPSSGIAQRETEALGPMLRRIRDTTGASLIVIEHDMPLIASVSDRLIALDLGRVVCDGGVRTVLNHPEVVASYLGTSPEVIARSGDVAERRPSPPKRPARTRPLKAR